MKLVDVTSTWRGLLKQQEMFPEERVTIHQLFNCMKHENDNELKATCFWVSTISTVIGLLQFLSIQFGRDKVILMMHGNV